MLPLLSDVVDILPLEKKKNLNVEIHNIPYVLSTLKLKHNFKNYNRNVTALNAVECEYSLLNASILLCINLILRTLEFFEGHSSYCKKGF